MRVAVVAHGQSETNRSLARSRWGELRAELLSPSEAMLVLAPGDVALGRLDVAPTLDGVEPGLAQLDMLVDRGVRVLNTPRSLLLAHDKLLTSIVLDRAGLPQPATQALLEPSLPVELELEPPVVLKPRFGSWGRDVVLCRTRESLERMLGMLGERTWFRAGAIVQEFIEPRGYDLRLVVAAGQVVGAVRRVAAPGEWRTNVALGATRAATVPPPAAIELALAAAAATRLDLVGVDLVPGGRDGFVVIELNGAVDFNREYRLIGDPFTFAAAALHRRAVELAERPFQLRAVG
jgi:RimK family alpha-L-glutamate ligase